jgi:hypothetical protein
MAGHHLFPFNRASDWVKRVVCNRFVGFRRAIDSLLVLGRTGGLFSFLERQSDVNGKIKRILGIGGATQGQPVAQETGSKKKFFV